MNTNNLFAPEPAQPDHPASWTGAQHPRQSDLQAPSATPHNPRRTVPYPSWPPPPEQSALYTNDHGSQWHGQHQYQQHQHHVPPPVAQPSYNPYQPTAGYSQHYDPHPQPQQQEQHFYRTPSPQDPRPVKRQRFDGPNLSGQSHHAPLRPQQQFEPLLFPAETTGVYLHHTQGLGDGERSGRLINAQLSASKRGRGAMADRGQGDGFIGPGAQAGQYGDGVCAHWSEGNFSGIANIQAEARNTIPTFAEPVATQLQGAHHVNMSGNPTLMNIGMNMGNLTTVNNCSGAHGLEKLEKFVSFAALHDSAEQDPDRRCHAGTRETVLAQLRDWFDNPNPTDRIVWLHGPAGAGKSAIAQTIADEYKERGVAATFFFYRSDPNRNDGKRLFPTISWQLTFSIPPTKDFIVDALNNTPHLPTQAVEPQFERLVARPFQSTAAQISHQAPVVIIDGVDECSDEKLQQRLLSVIGNAVKNHHVPLRFLIASRPEALIEETVNKFKDFTSSIDLAKIDGSHRDIHKYLEDKFSEIASTRGLDRTWPDYDPELLFNIVRNLTPRGNMSPFAILDELYLEILQRQRDQEFLKAFLALLVGRSSIKQGDLHEDDATLMSVSKKNLHTKLRRMRSLFKFKPFIDIYHKSFFDFLYDSSRSNQYHVSEEGGLKRYLDLIVESVVQHVSMAITNRHETCRYSPKFKALVDCYPPKIVLPVKDWQGALKPLLDLQDKLLEKSTPQSCHATQIMRDLLLHLVIMQGKTHPITAAEAPESNIKETATEWSPALVIEAQPNISEKDLDSCLSVFLSCLQRMNSVLTVDSTVIDCMASLLVFDCAETVAKVRCVSDAQNLVDIIDLLTNNESFLTRCGPEAARKAAHLASAIFARVPLLQRSLFLNKPVRYFEHKTLPLEFICQIVFISKILDHNYVFPVLGIYHDQDQFDFGIVIEQSENAAEWLRRSRPNFLTRIRVMLEIARIIRYIHSMDIALHPGSFELGYFFLDSNFRVKIRFMGSFTWYLKTRESNISNFAMLFHRVCFGGHDKKLHNRLVGQALQLIERCRDLESRSTMEDVVKEMETWDLT